MGTRKPFVAGLGFYTVASVTLALLLIAPTDARAITFGQWATGRWPDDIAPADVSTNLAPIDSLAGIGNYDWMTTPTTSLYLHVGQITSIESGTFTRLGKLATLDLDSNRITSIESGDFTGLDSLTRLDLSRNRITSIESGDFTGLDSLTGLDLSGNRITSIEPGDFTGLDSLTGLDLSDNRITSIEPGDFTGLDGLTYLSLGSNQITSIEPGDFTGLGSLRILDLSANQVTSVEASTFTDLGHLEELHLSGAQITRIESGVFTGLGNLEELFLYGGQITSIESGVFTGLGSLRTLRLSGGQITSIESGVFTGLGSLMLLYLGGNPALTNLNLEGADFSHLGFFDLTGDTLVSRVSLRNTRLNQSLLAVLVNGGCLSGFAGIGELPGVTELDLSGIDFAAITDLSPLYRMDHVTDLWLANVLHLDAYKLDVLLDNMAAMEDPNIEGVLYLTQADYEAFNTAGGGKLARWDAEAGHHVQIVPEPATLALLAGAVASLWFLRRGRRTRPR
jgi:Leucine-rich repeat (LRR) protein